MQFKQKLLSQNFFRSSELVSHLVGRVGYGKNDLVLDIGAGDGIITEQLAKSCGRVIAIEIDGDLVTKLQSSLGAFKNVRIHHADIRQFVLPQGKYKVFANLPFHITADVIYKLLYYSNPPKEAHVVVQREAAQKFSGVPHETQFSVLAKPWFNLEIVWRFRRSDFAPEPEVDVVLLKISKKKKPLIPFDQEPLYKGFIKFAFQSWKKDLKIGLQKIFSYEQWRRLAKENHFNIRAKPTDLTFNQWLAVFNFLLTGVNPERYEKMRNN